MISSEKEVGPVAANILLAEDDRALSALILDFSMRPVWRCFRSLTGSRPWPPRRSSPLTCSFWM